MSVLMILMHIAIHMNDVISCIHIASNHITSYPMYSNYTDVLSPTALKYNMNESTPRNMCVIHIYIYIVWVYAMCPRTIVQQTSWSIRRMMYPGKSVTASYKFHLMFVRHSVGPTGPGFLSCSLNCRAIVVRDSSLAIHGHAPVFRLAVMGICKAFLILFGTCWSSWLFLQINTQILVGS